MSARGRPFRFLAVVMVGWVGARVVLLWPQAGSLPEAIRALVPEARSVNPPSPAPSAAIHPAVPLARKLRTASVPKSLRPPSLRFSAPALVTFLEIREPPAAAFPPLVAPYPSATLSETKTLTPDRWSISGWFAARTGSAIATAPGGQLGGSQAGVRVAYQLATRERIAAFARLTAPLEGQGREAALGLEWQPGKAPIRLVAAHRFGLDGTPGGPEIGLVSGVEAKIANFRLETYGQAGAIKRQRIELYADGAARLVLPLGRISLGAGAWGAAQRDAQRLDTAQPRLSRSAPCVSCSIGANASPAAPGPVPAPPSRSAAISSTAAFAHPRKRGIAG